MSTVDAFEDLRRRLLVAAYGKEPPLTTARRSSGFSIEEDEAYRIAVWHYGYTGTRGDFWLEKDTATKRLRNKVFGINLPTPTQLFDVVTGAVSGTHYYQDSTRHNQKKKRKRRKQVMKKHNRGH